MPTQFDSINYNQGSFSVCAKIVFFEAKNEYHCKEPTLICYYSTSFFFTRVKVETRCFRRSPSAHRVVIMPDLSQQSTALADWLTMAHITKCRLKLGV